MTVDRQVMSITEGQNITCYKRKSQSSNVYVVDNSVQINGETIGCIGRFNADKSVTIFDVADPKDYEENTQSVQESNFDEHLLENIRNRTAIAATDAAMDENYLATYWIVTTKQNEVELDGGVETTKWGNGMIAAGEGIGLLDLIKNIVTNTKDLDSGEITIYNNNKKLI